MQSQPIPGKHLALLFIVALGACDCSDPPVTTQCMTDMECREGERCTPQGQCVVGVECVSEEECTAQDQRTLCNLETFQCEFREGFGDECDPTRPCPFGQFCSNLLGRCFVSENARDCVRRAQCPANQICDRNANKCIPDLGCYGDEFCEDGEFCDLVNRTCRALAVECTSCALDGMCPGSDLCFTDTKECLITIDDRACNDGETCDPLGRCVQCTNSAECGPGLFCNVSLGRCESNVQCVNDPSECPTTSEVTCVTCTAPEICDDRTRRCQAPPMICDSDLECPGEQFCDLTLDPPICVSRIPECLNDLNDDAMRNDDIASATLLDAAAGPLFDELRLCPGDQDWYRLEVSAGTYLTIDARFEHDLGDVELQLFLPDGRTLLDESRSTTDNERVELEVGTDLVVYARAFLGTPTIRSVPYRLVVARDPGSLCADDSHEEDDAREDAKQLLNDVPFEGRLCTGDPDWYVLRNVMPGTRVRTSLMFVDNLGDLDLELYRSNGTQPTRRSVSVTDNEEIMFDAAFGGDYFLRVIGKGADTNVYTIRTELREGMGDVCLDDTFEPNDDIIAATSTGALGASPVTATLCGGDSDWYRFHLAIGDALFAQIGFDPSADLDMKLFRETVTDPNQAPLRQAIGSTAREHIGFRNFEREGDYLLRVYGHTPFDVAEYEFDFAVTPFGACIPDAIDQQGRGNTLMDPFTLPLPPTRLDNLTFCDPDTDFYRIFVAGGFVNVLRLNFIPDDALLEIRLLDAGGNQIFTSAPGAGQQPNPGGFREVLITVPGQGFGVVILEVQRSQGFTTDYNITVDLEPVFNCQPDAAEPNNIPAMASLAASSSIAATMLDDLTMCTSVIGTNMRGDDDWFVLNPPAAGAVINASIMHDSGDMLLELFSPGGAVRACVNIGENRCFSDGNGLNEMVTFTATTTAPYLLRASSVWSSPNVTIRPADADTPYDLQVTYTQP